MRYRCAFGLSKVVLVFILLSTGMGVPAAEETGKEEPKLEKLSDKEVAALEARAAEARSLYDKGKYAEAEAVFQEIADRYTVSRPLYRCELAMSILAQGRKGEAQDLLWASYNDLLEFFDPKSEKKAAGIWGAESGKVYKGDPYEQATLCLLLGVLFLEKGDVDNALACFKSGQLADSDVANETYQADYALLQFLESHCYRLRNQPEAQQKLSETGINSLVSLAGEGQDREYAMALTQDYNTLVLIMSGGGPYMMRQGQYGENRFIVIENQRTNRYEILLDGEQWVDAIQGVGDINFQASTRGGREMDGVLKRHAKAKHTTSEIGDTFIQNVGGIEGIAVGLLFKAVSSAMTAQADIRCWQTLPGAIQPVPLMLTPGKHQLDVHAFDGYAYSHNKLVEIDVAPEKLNIVFVYPAVTETT